MINKVFLTFELVSQYMIIMLDKKFGVDMEKFKLFIYS